MIFLWGLSDSKSPHVSMTLLSILADLSNAVVLMVSARLPISNSSGSLNQPLGIVMRASFTVGISLTFRFNSFLSFLAKSKNLFLLLLSLIFTQWSTWIGKVYYSAGSLFLLTITMSGLLAEIRWSIRIPNSQRFCGSYSLGWFTGWVYTICLYDQISISYAVPSRSSFSLWYSMLAWHIYKMG